MIDLRFRSLEKFADPPGLKRQGSAFKMTYDKTLDLLEHELRQLRAHSITIEAGFKLDQIRNDGWPVSRAIPSHPGVVLYFKNGKGQDLRFPSGRYHTYQANLHAIALTLESLRAIDRYGVTLEHQQYIGFMLEAPKKLSVEEAAAFIQINCDHVASVQGIVANREAFTDAYRTAAKRLHPDAPGSANEHLWNLLQQAREVLNFHHGIK
jgi:hypothetical protein